MSVEQRRGLIEPGHEQLSIVRQCELVSFYYQPTGETAETLALMRLPEASASSGSTRSFWRRLGMGPGRWRDICGGTGTRSVASGRGG